MIPFGSRHHGPPSISTAPYSSFASSYPQSRKPPSVYFMMLPLCTSVTLFRPCAMAWSSAARIRRFDPSAETGLMPIELVSGKRMAVTPISFRRKPMSFTASGVPARYSMPA